jgi:AcrR family transcriptional regulator
MFIYKGASKMRMKDDQLRQILLDHSRTIIDDKSPELFTIRDLAEAADISIGTIYNYFNSKDDILFEVTALYWDEALIDLNQLIEDGPFYLQVEQIFHYLKTQISESGARLMHSLSNVRKTGTRRMQTHPSGDSTTAYWLDESRQRYRCFSLERFFQTRNLHMVHCRQHHDLFAVGC